MKIFTFFNSYNYLRMRNGTHVVSHGETSSARFPLSGMINSIPGVSNDGHGMATRSSDKAVIADNCVDNSQSVCEMSHNVKSSWKPLKFNEDQDDSNFIFYDLSQSRSYDVFDQLSQIYEFPVEQDNYNDDFKLYSLSDSDDDHVVPETAMAEFESTKNPTRVYYSVASTKEEIFSAFCNTADSFEDDDLDKNETFCMKPFYGGHIQYALEQAASARGLQVYIDIVFNPKTCLYNAKAVAGQQLSGNLITTV